MSSIEAKGADSIPSTPTVGRLRALLQQMQGAKFYEKAGIAELAIACAVALLDRHEDELEELRRMVREMKGEGYGE